MSKRSCSICAHANVVAIDAQLAAGVNQKDIAQQFQVSRFAISRHWRNCLAVSALASNSGDSREEIAKWLKRADDQYLLANANADQRGAVASLVAGLRATEAKVRSEEREAETAPDAESDDQFTPHDFAKFDRILTETDERAHQLVLSESQRLLVPDCYELFTRMWQKPSLKTAVLDFARDWQEKVGEDVPQIAN